MSTVRPWVVRIFLISIIIIFIAQRLFNLPLVENWGLRDIRSLEFRYYQIFSHAFIHADTIHLLRNAFAFWVFAPRIELMLGKKRFITFIIFTGLGAATCQSLVNFYSTSRIKNAYTQYEINPSPKNFNKYLKYFNSKERGRFKNFEKEFELNYQDDEYLVTSISLAHQLYELRLNTASLGASGIIFALLVAFAMLFPNDLIYLIFFPLPMKVKYFTILYGIYELYLGSKNNPVDNVAHFAHLGGMIFGYLFMKWWKKKYSYVVKK